MGMPVPIRSRSFVGFLFDYPDFRPKFSRLIDYVYETTFDSGEYDLFFKFYKTNPGKVRINDWKYELKAAFVAAIRMFCESHCQSSCLKLSKTDFDAKYRHIIAGKPRLGKPYLSGDTVEVKYWEYTNDWRTIVSYVGVDKYGLEIDITANSVLLRGG